MLPLIIRKICGTVVRPLIHTQIRTITTSKSLLQRKKQIYQSQSSEPKQQTQSVSSQSKQAKQKRQKQFQEMLFQLAKEMMQYFNIKTGSDKELIDITSLLARHQTKMIKELRQFEPNELINYIEVVKNMCLTRLEHIDNIDTAYRQLARFMNVGEHQQVLREHVKSLWQESTTLQTKIRSVCLLQFMDEQGRKDYLSRIVPLIKYFKSIEVLILLYEKLKYKYNYSYELIDQIHSNQFYISMEDINQSYLKMLFLQSIKGQFSPNEDGIYNKIFVSFQQKPNVLAHSAFHKYVKILHSQGFFVQTDYTRHQLEHSLNTFINIAKNQNYYQTSINLSQLVELYLGFQETNSTGEILLNQITYISKTSQLKIDKQNFPLYQKLLASVLKNIQKKLKYQRRDYLNKEYTYDTINFLKEFLPKYIEIWPQVIFELNHASFELFPSSQKKDQLLDKFQSVFKAIMLQKNSEITLKNIDYTLKLLRFLNTNKDKKCFEIQQKIYISLLTELSKNIEKQSPTNQQLQVLYLILTLVDTKCKEGNFKKLIQNLNQNLIEKEMNKELQKEEQQSPIASFDHSIIWLALCSAKIKYHDFLVDQSIVEVFLNQKLYYMINTLQYKEVYQILVFTSSLSRLSIEIYERLLSNLSTFIIYIHQKNTKNSVSSFYLNQQYLSYYVPICRLVLENKTVFKKVREKDSFKVVQIMMIKNISLFSNNDILEFLQILGHPSFLSISMNKYIEELKFTAAQLQHYQDSSTIRSFQYYNKSLLRFFEGKYNQSEIKKRLKEGSLSKSEIQQYFSKIEVYKTIIMDGDLAIRFQMPEPKTSIPDFKYMYACQRIYQKIEKTNNFNFHQGFKIGGKPQVKSVDLQSQKNYISKEVLVPQNTDNEFRMQNRTFSKYIKVEVWKSFVFFDKQCMIDPKDLFLNSKKLTDQILNKIMKGVFGKFQKIRQVVKQFSCNDDLINLLSESNIKFEQHGAAIEFKKIKEGEETNFTLLCTSNSNYKILYICAYFMEKHGITVAILKENQDIHKVIQFLKEHLGSASEFAEKQAEEGQQRQNEQ